MTSDKVAGCGLLAIVLTAAWTTPASATFPGRNGALVYSRGQFVDDAGEGHTEYQLLIDKRTGTYPFVSSSDGRLAGAVWSPSGTDVAYSSCIFVEGVQSCNIRLTSDDAYVTSDVTPLTKGVVDFDPTWAPDGSRIAFVTCSAEDTDCELVVLDMTTHKRATLTDDVEYEAAPSWDPTRDRIVFQRAPAGGTSSLYLLVQDDGKWSERRLTKPAASETVWAQDPNWHPSGRRIVFSRIRQGGAADIFTIRPDGTSLSRVVRMHGLEEDPIFSPNATRLAYVSATEDTLELRILNLETMRSAPVAEFQSHEDPFEFDPDWRALPRKDT